MTKVPYSLLPTPEPTLLAPSSKHPLSSTTTELSSSTLNSRILSLSDEFFAAASCLLSPLPPLSMKGQFGPKGALYDGWETRRHNAPESDWVVIGLGPRKSTVWGFEVDTRWFTGNEGPAVSVFGMLLEGEEREKEGEVDGDDKRWEPLLPIVPLQPAHQHFYSIPPTTSTYSHILLRMHPDGGIGRFRVYGIPSPPSPSPLSSLSNLAPSIAHLSNRIDLASALNGGRTTSCSDQHFANASNLLIPGRGVDMGDGWETRRSRDLGHKEWAVVRLCGERGQGGRVECVEVDSAFHMGNFPKYASVEAIHWDEDVAPAGDELWTTIVPKSVMGPHRQHFFPVDPDLVNDVTHVRVSIYPDGGLKRLRVWGHQTSTQLAVTSFTPTIEALPLTYETFLPYGHVIQGYSTPTAAPKGVIKTTANQGTAAKYHKMAPLLNNYGPGEAQTDIRTVRAGAQVTTGTEFDIKILERHLHTTQTVIAMGRSEGPMGGSMEDDGAACISIVALPGLDGQPDLSTLRAFFVPTHQAVSYGIGIWHHPLLTVNKTVDYAVIETSPLTDGRVETEYWTPSAPVRKLLIPELPSKPRAKKSVRSAHTMNGSATGISSLASKISASLKVSSNISCIRLTAQSFAKFGKVVQTYGSEAEAPSGAEFEEDEQYKTATTYKVAPVRSSYKPEWKATTALSCFRSTPKEGMEKGKPWPVHFLERHPYTEQTFIPLGTSTWRGKTEEPLAEGAAYIVICAEPRADGKPDAATIQAFFCTADQGVNYSSGVWHHPMLTVGGAIDLACVEAQTSSKSDSRDCELLEFDEPLAVVDIPSF